MRIAKWTAIIAGSLLLLLVATAFVMTSVIDPNRYRGKVEHIVADLAGRPFVIEGNLKLTWYPWLGVTTGPAHLSDLPGASNPLVEWQSVFVAAKVLPLLKGQVVVDRIVLRIPRIRLHRDAHGHGNWENLGPRGPSSANQNGPPQIAGLEIRDGILDYVDDTSGLRMSLSGLDLDLGEWRNGQPLAVHARCLVKADSLPPSGVRVVLDVPQLGVKTSPLRVSAPTATLQVADAKIDGDFNFQQSADSHVSAHGLTAVHAPSVRKLAEELALNQTMPHDPTTLGPVELTALWSFTDGALTAKPITLKLDGVNFYGWIERSEPPESAWRFELHGDQIDLGRYVNVDTTSKKPFELPVEALRAFNANGSLIFDQAILADTRLSDVRLRFQTPEIKE